jgi:hypothetical protein
LLTSGIILSLCLAGCSGGTGSSAGPKPGTLGHAWLSAKETYNRGEYLRSMEHLSRVAANESEYRENARAMLMLISAGAASGFQELAEAYDTGAKINKAKALEFRRQMINTRNMANNAALQFAEATHEFLAKSKDGAISFEFGFPAGDASEPLQLARINKGFNLQQADIDAAATAMLRRGVIRVASEMAGSPKDLSKAAAAFPSPPREVFLSALATTLYKSADLYCPRKLDIPRRGNALCQEALEAIALLPDGKDKKALEGKVKSELKRYKIAS